MGVLFLKNIPKLLNGANEQDENMQNYFDSLTDEELQELHDNKENFDLETITEEYYGNQEKNTTKNENGSGTETINPPKDSGIQSKESKGKDSAKQPNEKSEREIKHPKILFENPMVLNL